MRPFRDLPIKRKLTLVILFSATAGLVLAGAAMFVFEVQLHRREVVSDIVVQTRILSAGVGAAVAFEDPKAAAEILDSLKYRPGIVAAYIYGRDDQLFASYPPAGTGAAPTPPKAAGQHFQGSHVLVFQPIALEGERVGILGVRADLQQLRSRMITYLAILVGVILMSLVVASLVAARLQRTISAPLLALAGMTRAVRQSQDYSLRATRESRDEVGELVEGMNLMLAQIQRRDAALTESEERFRQLAESIREVFWLTDVDKNRIIYISPGYEEIWGRTCASLYESPRSWLESIHPEDRERVLHAALTRQATGDYDEEYRIVRPDGSIRWIHDRAFPVRDKAGRVYRVTGIAADVTERHQMEAERQKFVSLVDNSNDFIAMASLEGHILYVNPAGRRLVGLDSLADARTKNVRDFRSEEAWSKAGGAEVVAMRTQGFWEGETQLRHFKTGDAIDVQVNSFLIRDPTTGTSLCQATMQRDITERKRMEREILEISDRERSRIGQEIHDNLCQLLVGTGFSANLLLQELKEKSLPAANDAFNLLTALEQSIDEAYNLSRGSFLVQLDAEGLVSMLQELARSVERRSKINCMVEYPAPIAVADDTVATHVFRIAQEAVNNAVKHAKPSRIVIRLAAEAETLHLRVTNDGLPFPASPPRRGLGLYTMRYRARVIDGRVEIQLGSNGETILDCAFPRKMLG